jgi:Flp pilus assembly protein TadD
MSFKGRFTLVGFLIAVALCLTGLSMPAVSADSAKSEDDALSTDAFSPSNARTEGDKLIPVDQFFPAARCAKCHRDTHTAWSESLHRNAAREPFYRESADILLRTRGIEATRHCESCHTPVALFSGALTKASAIQQAPFTRLDDEGVTCSVCHSITGARLDGTGSFTIRRPALLATEDGTPILGDVSDEQILNDVPAHKRAVMRPLLRQPEFCATCHKVDAPPALNNYKHVRGFSAYDEWQQSKASTESVSPFYRSAARIDCRGCHMPKVESRNDRAAKQGVIASHRWLGANTVAPLFYGQSKQVELTKDFLKAKVVSVDIFAIGHEASSERIAPLAQSAENQTELRPGEEITVDVVIANRKAAHSIAPEVRDLYEVWVEFEALDNRGETIFHSGFIKPDGMLDEKAHVYKTIILDQASRPITRHQIWTTSVKAYDSALQAGRSDIARFRFCVPAAESIDVRTAITLRARVNYRRFNQEYTDYVLRRRNALMVVPIVEMAQAEARLISGPSGNFKREARQVDAEQESGRWNDYGIGLLEQAQYGAAADAFRRASELNPRDPNPLVSAAIAELRTERFGPELAQLRKARILIDAARQLDPSRARTRFFHALLLRSERKVSEAADELINLAQEYPRDREVARQVGQTLYSLGRISEARAAFENVIAIDPTDFEAYKFLSPIYLSEGRKADAERAYELYLQWRDDPLAGDIAARFFARNPMWSDERIVAHTHGSNTQRRPTLTGAFAAPDN